ncbi:MAG: alpha/beta hydrolase [Oxalobacter sp.]|nr:alpha/beta hydrolase [Oxalobacter sp.]
MKKILSALLLCAAVSFPAYGQGVHYFGQTDQDTVSQVPYGNNVVAGHFVKAGDARIYYEVYGKGEPVLVLHGGGVGCTYEMGRFIDELAKDHLVIAPSTRGHGKSEIGVKPITYAQKAEDMMAAVNQITKKPMVILGFSDGAYTAYKIAAMYPDRIRKIVASGAGENVPGLRKIPMAKLADFAALDKRFIDEKVALCPEPDKLQDYLDRYFAFFNQEAISKALFNSIKCPVLLIAGEKDANAPLDTVISAYKMMPNAQLAIIADAPHQAFIMNFEAVWANVKPFLKD